MTKSNKILLIGNAKKAFGISPKDLNGITVCDSVLIGIEQTRKIQFHEIFIVLSSISGQIQQALQTLRQCNPRARLILLAQMLEEPMAMGLVRNDGAGRPLADDYQICPILPETIFTISTQRPAEPLTSEKELEYQKRIRQLEMLATEDDLTGLKNRRYLNQFLAQILSLARQYHFQVTLLLFDIDNFKQYNDLFGHAVGDDVLIQVGKMIRHCCRGHDVVSRMGGDEFAVVFWDLPEKQRLAEEKEEKAVERRKADRRHPRETLFMAERFRNEIAAAKFPLLGPSGQGKLTISGGLASFPTDGKTAETLIARADEAMLEAKRQGKNQIVIIGEKNNSSPQSLLDTAAGTVPALEKKQESKTTAKTNQKGKRNKPASSATRIKPASAAGRKKKL